MIKALSSSRAKAADGIFLNSNFEIKFKWNRFVSQKEKKMVQINLLTKFFYYTLHIMKLSISLNHYSKR